MTEYEKDYEEFWKDVVESNGVLDIDKVKRELFDYHFVMKNVSEVYMAVTGGKLSKPNYYAETIITEFEDYVVQCVEEEIKERIESGELVKCDTSMKTGTEE